jgi:hypothetical protein
MNAYSIKNEPNPEGYTEALKDCVALATNLLSIAINDESIKRCWDCRSWVGRCLKGKIWAIARNKACSNFTSKQNKDNDKTVGNNDD